MCVVQLLIPHVWRVSQCLATLPMAATDALRIYLLLIIGGQAQALTGDRRYVHTTPMHHYR
jgi:hypothetical protein